MLNKTIELINLREPEDGNDLDSSRQESDILPLISRGGIRERNHRGNPLFNLHCDYLSQRFWPCRSNILRRL